MSNPGTSLSLMMMTALSLAAAALAVRRLMRPERRGSSPWMQHGLIGVIAVWSAGLFVYRWMVVHGRWQPLSAHLDGLLLIATLLAATILFIQSRARLFGLSAFGIPMLSFILAWAICASAWTYRPFHLTRLDRAWYTLHLASVYLGTLCSVVAAVAGGMYLYVQYRLKRKQDLRGLGRLASLEALEDVIVRMATLGFALLTLGLVAGVVIVSEVKHLMQPGWWYSPKIVLGAVAWVVYALLMNVRYASSFRGGRAAWLSIAGLVLLIATYGVITVSLNQGAGRNPSVVANGHVTMSAPSAGGGAN